MAGLPLVIAGGEHVVEPADAHERQRAREQRPRLRAALTESADELRSFREIATLQVSEREPPPDRATDLKGGAQAARRYGMNRLAERLEKAESVTDL